MLKPGLQIHFLLFHGHLLEDISHLQFHHWFILLVLFLKLFSLLNNFLSMLSVDAVVLTVKFPGVCLNLNILQARECMMLFSGVTIYQNIDMYYNNKHRISIE